MGLFDRVRSERSVIVRSDRQRRRLEREVASAVTSVAGAGDQVHEFQPLIQITSATGYAAWRAAWERSWRKKKSPYGTGQWPKSIAEDEVAALLVPVFAGRVGTALGKHPKPVAEPSFLVGELADGADIDDAALAVLSEWLRNVAPPGSRCAPPVLETIVGGRVARRWTADFGASWPLPPADGL